jgi:site-specific recombinase XerD
MKSSQVTFSQALDGYDLSAEVQRFSPHTLLDYENTFNKFMEFLGTDLPMVDITKHHIQEFLNSFPHLSPKTIRNYHAGLSSLWTWATTEGLVDEHIVRQVTPPKAEEIEIVPFSEEDVKLILYACQRSRSYRRSFDRENISRSLPNYTRNKAIILTLLDTGVRANELCHLKIRDLDLRNRQISVKGKGNKTRVVEVCGRTVQVISQYLRTRPDLVKHTPLFIGNHDIALTRNGLLQLIRRLGERANVQNAYPHRFRHTFAINFLRNGGNIFALQKLLGHSTLDMVKRYLKLAQQDCAAAHRIASPVANWDL